MRVEQPARRRWTVALFASLLAHALLLATVRFIPAPPNPAVDESSPSIAILRITKTVPAHVRRGGAPAAPRIETPSRSAAAAIIASGALTRGSARAATTAAARASRAAASSSRANAAPSASKGRPAPPAPGAAGSFEPSPEAVPTITPELLAQLNVRMREALPSAMPQTMKLFRGDLATLAIRLDPNRLTAANYPLPASGLFAHAKVARTAHEAIAVRAIQRIGRAYICIGYLARVGPDLQSSKAGPYIGPCKAAWREQLGLTTKPSPSPAPSSEPPASPSPEAT